MQCTTRTALILGFALVAIAPSESSAQVKPSLSRNVELAIATAARFHELLAGGDSAGAVSLLAPDVTVVESGGVESRDEYLAHHLGADIEFARSVHAGRKVVSARRHGDVVWIVATSEVKGTMRGRPIESRGAELMVLSRSGAGWLIRAVHWSSQPRRQATP